MMGISDMVTAAATMPSVVTFWETVVPALFQPLYRFSAKAWPLLMMS